MCSGKPIIIGLGVMVFLTIAAEAKSALHNISRTPFRISFSSTARQLAVGDPVFFTLISKRPCSLTLFDIDGKGSTTQLLPNSRTSVVRIDAGVPFHIPGVTLGGFMFRATELGFEKITATCVASLNPEGTLTITARRSVLLRVHSQVRLPRANH